MNYINILDASGAYSTPLGADQLIVDYFNNLGWWGNLLLILLSLVLSTLFSGLIGYQREVNGHAAGLRTHILISLGSSLIMILSLYGVVGTISRDPMRLAAAGVTGIGFLGSGVIIKNGVTVKGLTTSATIWITMAIGMACGAGYFIIAGITTAIALISLIFFQYVENWSQKKNANILIVVETSTPYMASLIEILDKYGITYKDLNTNLAEVGGKQVLRISLRCSCKLKNGIANFIDEFRETVNPISISINN